MLAGVVLLIVLFLSYTNGANDNFKGVATLYGSGELTFGRALTLASVFTFLGVVLAAFYAQGMIKSFSGKGMVSDEAVGSLVFIAAVALGTAFTVFLATKLGMPVSTTHGLIGAMVGAGWMENSAGVHLSVLGKVFLLPLLLSPLVAIFLGWLLARIPSPNNRTSKQWRYLHFVAGAGVCFTRGMNDGPKIAGMLILITFLNTTFGLLLIGLAMIVGGILQSKKVAETMSHKMAKLSPNQGAISSLTTALMVLIANLGSLPVSTTHVSVGSIYGVSLHAKSNDHKVFFDIVKSWILTLPIASALGCVCYLILNTLSTN